MVTLNYFKQQVALILGGSTTNVPTYFMIGNGSGTVAITQTSLIAPLSRQLMTGSADVTAPYFTTLTGDFNSVQMNGISLTEWGITISGGGTTGSMWTRTAVPAIVFDGTNELRIVETTQVY